MTTLAQKTRIQYVYDFATLDRVPEGPASAKVAAKRLVSGPTLQTGKSSTVGAVLTGEHIIVALAGQNRGSGAKAHTHPNEQFNYIPSLIPAFGQFLRDDAADQVETIWWAR